jgi:hypothetical protein
MGMASTSIGVDWACVVMGKGEESHDGSRQRKKKEKT